MANARYSGLGQNYGVVMAFKKYDDPSTTLTHDQWIAQVKADLNDMWRDGVRSIRLWLYNPQTSPAFSINNILEIGSIAKDFGFYVIGGVTSLGGPTLNDANWNTISSTVVTEAQKAAARNFDEFIIDNEAYGRISGLTNYFTKYGALATAVKAVFTKKRTICESENYINNWIGQTIGSGTFADLDYLGMNCYGGNNTESGFRFFLLNLLTCWNNFGTKSYISEFNLYTSQPYSGLKGNQIYDFTKFKVDKIFSIGFTRAFFFSYTSPNDEFAVKKADGTFLRNREALTNARRNVDGVS